MTNAKSVVGLALALALALIVSWAHADSHTCLSIENPWPGDSIALWVNQCDVGVDVTWRDEGGCKSQPGNKYPCSSYVAPNAKTGATLEGRIGWVECESPGGLGDVVALERPDGSTYCWGDPSPRERTDLVRRRERQSQELQRRRLEAEAQRHAEAQRLARQRRLERERRDAEWEREQAEREREWARQQRDFAERQRRNQEQFNNNLNSLLTIIQNQRMQQGSGTPGSPGGECLPREMACGPSDHHCLSLPPCPY